MIIEGLATTSDADHVNDIIAVGAFADSIARRGLSGPRGIRLLAQHDRALIIGAIKELKQASDGLRIKAEIDEKIGAGKEMAAMVRAAGGLNFSPGFRIGDCDLLPTGGLLITRADLHEISVVTFPANDRAQMTSFKDDQTPLQAAVDAARQLKELASVDDPAATAAAAAAELKRIMTA